MTGMTKIILERC